MVNPRWRSVLAEPVALDRLVRDQFAGGSARCDPSLDSKDVDGHSICTASKQWCTLYDLFGVRRHRTAEAHLRVRRAANGDASSQTGEFRESMPGVVNGPGTHRFWDEATANASSSSSAKPLTLEPTSLSSDATRLARVFDGYEPACPGAQLTGAPDLGP